MDKLVLGQDLARVCAAQARDEESARPAAQCSSTVRQAESYEQLVKRRQQEVRHLQAQMHLPSCWKLFCMAAPT